MSKRKRINHALQTSTRGVNDRRITCSFGCKTNKQVHSDKFIEITNEFEFQSRLFFHNGEKYLRVFGTIHFKVEDTN